MTGGRGDSELTEGKGPSKGDGFVVSPKEEGRVSHRDNCIRAHAKA